MFTGPEGRSVEPAESPPGPDYLTPGTWEVSWTLQRASADKNGLQKLIEAQKLITPGAEELTVLKKTTWDGSDVVVTNEVTTTNVISTGISPTSTDAPDESGAVYFNLEYVPFLNGTNPWDGYSGDFRGDWAELTARCGSSETG